MSAEQIIRIIARLFAIYLLLTEGIQLVIINFNSFPNEVVTTGYKVGVCVVLFIAVFLWFFPIRLARGIIPKEENAAPASGTSLKEIQTLCYSLLGLWVMLGGLSSFSWSILPIHRDLDALWVLVPSVLQIILGLGLFLGAKGVGGFVNWLRNAPRKSPLE